jgi:hypothetical protein
MRVFVAGASVVVGVRLVRLLVAVIAGDRPDLPADGRGR